MLRELHKSLGRVAWRDLKIQGKGRTLQRKQRRLALVGYVTSS